MTKFTDGPAAGITLMIRRAPLFLRVVQSREGKWDALDQLADKPEPGETIHAYRKTVDNGHVHICRSGGMGGCFHMAEYEHVPEQPALPILQARSQWQAWCSENAEAWVEERVKREAS